MAWVWRKSTRGHSLGAGARVWSPTSVVAAASGSSCRPGLRSRRRDHHPSVCRPPPWHRPTCRAAARATQHLGAPRPPPAESLRRISRRASAQRTPDARRAAFHRRADTRRCRDAPAAGARTARTAPLAVYAIRRATAADAGVLARHRAEMFRDMSELPDDLYDTLVEAARAYFAAAIVDGRYVGWVAELDDPSGAIVAGAGLQLRDLLPRPDVARERLVRGPQALILNVFTERAWRRRGIADALMRELLRWCRGNGIESVVLHASGEGRPLYEKLGFTPTNEMRYGGGL